MCLQRVMPSYWYVLLRYFLRVDDVLVRSNETRMFHMLESEHVLREYTVKEAYTKDLKVSMKFRFFFKTWDIIILKNYAAV